MSDSLSGAHLAAAGAMKNGKDLLNRLLEGNRRWARQLNERDPSFFARLASQQTPDVLWIGCSDSRVPATEICGVEPGEIFVHRNIANQVVHTDMNLLSVLQYAVSNLGVKHIIVCGHYGCGGIAAALTNDSLGLLDHWLRHIRDIAHRCHEELMALPAADARLARLCERNVEGQVAQVVRTSIVQKAWASGQALSVHGWIYGLSDGVIKDLGISATGPDDVPPRFRVH